MICMLYSIEEMARRLFLIKRKEEDNVTIILLLGVASMVRIQASSRAIQALMEENRLIYSHWATPFQSPAQLITYSGARYTASTDSYSSNTFIIYQDQDIFAVNGILGHA
jgi:hypothetical protein